MALSQSQFERLKQLSLKERPGRLEETRQDILETGRGISREVGRFGEKAADIVVGDLSLAEKVTGVGAEAFRGVSRTVGETVVGVGKAILPQRAEEAIAGKVEEVGEKIGEQKFVQDIVRKYQYLSPEDKRTADNILGFGEGLLDLFGLGKVVKPVISAATRGVREVAGGVVVTARELLRKATPESVVNFQKRLKRF